MIGAVVLAAGESRRMGSQKLLLPFGKTTIIGHIVDQILPSVVDEVVVVTGHESEKVAAALSGRMVTVVENPNYPSGMLSSVRCGLRALPCECQTVLIALGDQPTITTALIDGLVRAFTGSGKGIAVPVFGGLRGHPLLFAERYRGQILMQYDDVGLRGLLHAHPDDVFEMPALTPAVLADIDYPKDYRQALAT